jgi:hypothetical protein
MRAAEPHILLIGFDLEFDFIRNAGDSPMDYSNKSGFPAMKPNGGPSIDLKAAKPADTASAVKPAGPAPTASAGPQPAAPEVKAPGKGTLHPLAAEMQQKWSKLSDADLDGVKSQQELAAIIETRYGIAAEFAKTQVQAWAQGRSF